MAAQLVLLPKSNKLVIQKRVQQVDHSKKGTTTSCQQGGSLGGERDAPADVVHESVCRSGGTASMPCPGARHELDSWRLAWTRAHQGHRAGPPHSLVVARARIPLVRTVDAWVRWKQPERPSCQVMCRSFPLSQPHARAADRQPRRFSPGEEHVNAAEVGPSWSRSSSRTSRLEELLEPSPAPRLRKGLKVSARNTAQFQLPWEPETAGLKPDAQAAEQEVTKH